MSDLSRQIASLTPERRRLLELLLRQRGVEAPPLPIAPADRGSPIPLSFAQQRLWFLDQLAPGDPAFNIPTGVLLEGELRLDVLARALAQVARRHEVLRTVFPAPDGEPVQEVRPPLPPPLPLVDLGALGEAVRRGELMRLTKREARRPFDLTRGPLWRAVVYRLGARQHAVLLTLHHVVTDDWSMTVLAKELSELYSALAARRAAALPDLPVQYADYAVWQRRCLDAAAVERHLAYWRETLAGAPEELSLPTDLAGGPVSGSRGGAHPFRLDPQLSSALDRLAADAGVTLFALLAAVYALLLGWFARQDDVVIGTPVANRDRAELEPLIGLFFNTVPLRTRLRPAASFRDLLRQVAATVNGAFAHRELPFDRLVEALRPERRGSRLPLFRVTMTLHNAPWATPALGDLVSRPFPLDYGTVRADLMFDLIRGPEHLHATLSYHRDLFLPATAARLAAHLKHLLQRVADEPALSLAELRAELERTDAAALAEQGRSLRRAQRERLGSLRRRAASAGRGPRQAATAGSPVERGEEG